MSRRVVPNWFVAYRAPLRPGVHGLVIRAQLRPVLEAFKQDVSDRSMAPVALRWTTSPDLGFPRAPFEVWARRRDDIHGQQYTVTLRSSPHAVTGQSTLSWTDGMYLLEVLAVPEPGWTLTIRPIDVRGKALPHKKAVLTTSGSASFVGPGITGLSVTGRGSITNVIGVEQNAFANAQGWSRVETVGFPFKPGEVALPVYDPRAQGLGAGSLSGFVAAHLRLAIAEALHSEPPAIPSGGTPVWPAADPAAYLALLRGASPAPLGLIHACLTNSNDSNPSQIQALYRETIQGAGIRQADVPGATAGADPTSFEVPAVATTVLATSADSAAATGLGYGTIHLAVDRLHDLFELDYMITDSFTLPHIGTLVLAAFAEPLAPPASVDGLTASRFGLNRPPARDAAASESVVLRWDVTALPASHGIAVGDAPNAARVLNTPRPPGAGGYVPFVPQRPEPVGGEVPVGARTSFVDAVSPVPLSGSRTNTYFVIGRDVFDRWSPSWTQATHTATAPLVQVPGLHRAELELDAAHAVGKSVPATLVIDVSWDWADRSPNHIEIHGKFFPAGAAAVPSPSFTGGVQLASAAPFGPPVLITFDAFGTPRLDHDAAGNQILPPYAGSVVEVLAAPPPGGPPPPTTSVDIRRYRVHLTNVSCDFSITDEVAYAVTAGAAEMVRPSESSAVVGPRVARAPNPLPAEPPTLPGGVIWTALPDAAGRARAVLSWPAVAGASGYVVWEATEAALWTAANLPTPAHGTPIVTRASALRSAITGGGESASLHAFSRLNERKLAGTSLEVTLPRSADTLYAYRVSSITAQGVDSARSSTVALVAVPRRNKPGTPRLSLRTRRTPVQGIQVIVVPGPQPVAAGFRVHRIRRSTLAERIGTMGPPKIEPSDAGWAAIQVDSLVGPSEAGHAILDPVAPSWYPYHYRAVAIGTEDLAGGEHAAESLPSGTQSAVLTPAQGPVVSGPTVTNNAATRLVAFSTDLPVRMTPVGRATIAVLGVGLTTDGSSIRRTPLLLVHADEVVQGAALTLLPAAPPEGQVNRRVPDSAGVAEYTVLLDAAVTSGVVVVTDPLGRSAEVVF
ncbi:MAG TPA: hypothetical protein VG318_17965 [Actinomycetota bacterium]|nr:hypothetical protein [Actinomycetota bacterium]